MSIADSKSWKQLLQLAENQDVLFETIKQNLFAGGEHSPVVKLEGISLDFSKQLITPEIQQGLMKLCVEASLKTKISQLFSASPINTTENRSVAHWLLRGHSGSDPVTREWYTEVKQSLDKMAVLVDKIHSGHWRGFSGKAIKDVVNLGVGGSELGPLSVIHTLSDTKLTVTNPVNVHFASSIDGSQLSILLEELNPETTLFLLSSKSFTTIDTFSNAETAKKWLTQFCSDEVVVINQHFIGISSKPGKMTAWGLAENNQLLFWDWVGGRYSLWSAIGLPIALKIGMQGFNDLLAGAHAVDEHFLAADFEKNLPVLLAMTGIWNINFLNIRQHAVLPYDGRFKYFPQYLQQLEMESNGKSVTGLGETVNYSTCPVIWGEVGPNAQHAFYQLLHQGTQKVSSDFIAVINRYDHLEKSESNFNLKYQQLLCLSNCLAQSRVLLFGDDVIARDDNQEETPIYKRYPGGQPSTTILIDKLTPYSLGQLLALYEHKVFVQSIIWDINPFDQWGVELGKVMANETFAWLNNDEKKNRAGIDQSTRMLIAEIQQKINKPGQTPGQGSET